MEAVTNRMCQPWGVTGSILLVTLVWGSGVVMMELWAVWQIATNVQIIMLICALMHQLVDVAAAALVRHLPNLHCNDTNLPNQPP